MSSYSDLASQIINKDGKGGKFSGLNTFLDVQLAFKQAQQEFQFKKQLEAQQSTSEAAKGISQAGIMSGLTPDTNTAMGQYNDMVAGNMASGPSGQVPSSMQMQSNNGTYDGVSVTGSNEAVSPDTGKITITSTPKSMDLTIQPNDSTKSWDGKYIAPTYRNKSIQARTEKVFADRVDGMLKSTTNQIGRNNSKVENGILAQKMIDQYYDPKTKDYNIPPTRFFELSMAIAKVLNPSGALTNEQINGVKQSSLAGNWGEAMTWVTGTPHTGTSQDIIKDAVATMQRESIAAEDLRNKDLEMVKKQVPGELNVASVKQILSSLTGANSIKKYLKEQSNSPDLSANKYQGEDSSQNSNRIGKYTFQ